MKARRLVVLRLDNDPESVRVSGGLISKYRSRCETLIEISLVDSRPNVTAGTRTADFGGEIGAYVIAHGAGPEMQLTSIFSPPDDVIRGLKAALGDDFTSLQRIVMVTCNLMPKKPPQGQVERYQFSDYNLGDDNTPYVLVLLSKLKAAGVHPIVVGWDCYVTALPHVPPVSSQDATPSTVYRNPKTGTGPLSAQDLAAEQVQGKKLIKDNRLGFASHEASRAKHKRAFRVQEGNEGPVMIVSPNGWSTASLV